MSSDLPAPPPPPGRGPWPLAPPPRRPVPLDEPRRTSPFTIAIEAVGLAFFALTMVATWLAGGGAADVPGVVIGLLITLQRTVGWWFRTYTVTETAITLDEGILGKRHRVVPFSRIQQVEHRQQLVARLFGLVAVHVETAGERGATAITLSSLDLATAEALRDHLLAEQRRVRAGRPAAPAPGDGSFLLRHAPEPTRVLQLTPTELVVAGATSNAVVSVAALTVVPAAVVAGRALDGTASLVLFAGIEVAVTLGVVALGVLGSVLAGWGFDLTETEDDLSVSQGLLDRRQHTMPRHRLQHARVVDNPVRRALGIVSLDLFSAATPGAGDQQQRSISIPYVRRRALEHVLVDCMGAERWRPPELAPRPPAARRRAVTRRTALTALMTAAVVVALLPAGIAVAPLALLGIPWGRLAHRRAGSALDRDVLVVASGALVHHLELIPSERVQSRRSTSSPFQRRSGLATLRLDVAGGSPFGAPGLRDLAADDAERVRGQVAPRARRAT